MTDPQEEAERQRRMHEFERHTARLPEQPGPDRADPVHVLRVALRDQPGIEVYYLARWSLIARLRRAAEGSGDELADLGPDAMLIAQAAQRGEFGMGEYLRIGVAADGRWLRWEPPFWPVEPVPGSLGEQAQRN
jgi:hypothetical protein